MSIRTVSAVRKPGSNRDDAIALRRKIAAQISSSAEAKTCTPISALRARPGRASFTSSPRSVRTGSIRVACSAGISAKNAVAAIAATTRNSATRQSAAGTLMIDVAEVDGRRAQGPIDRAFEREPRDQVAAGRRRQREQHASRSSAGGQCGAVTRRARGERRSHADAPRRARAAGWRRWRSRSAGSIRTRRTTA